VAVLEGQAAPADFFVPPAQEAWQSTLAALAGIAAPAARAWPWA
jgi:hypothetical protein